MELSAPCLETEEIRLEPLSEAFREVIRDTGAVDFMWISLPAIERGAGYDVYFNYSLKASLEGTIPSFMVLDKTDNNRFVGTTAFIEPNKIHRRIQLGYTWLEPKLRGKGVYPQIQMLMIQRALEWGAKRLEWPIEAHNERAIRATEALGAQNEGTLRNYMKFAEGAWVDVTILSMMRDEAKEAVRRLSARIEEHARA